MTMKPPPAFIALLKLALLFPLVSLSAADKTPPPQPPFLLEDFLPELMSLIELAKTEAPRLRNYHFRQEESSARFQQKRSRQLPSINFSLQTGPREEFRSGRNNEDTSIFALNAGLFISQPLYHWGAIKADVERARLATGDAYLAKYAQEAELIRNLRSDYLSLLMNGQYMAREQRRLKIAREKAEKIADDFESGRIQELDLLAARVGEEQLLLSIARVQAHRTSLLDRMHEVYGWTKPVLADDSLPELETERALEWVESAMRTLHTSLAQELLPIQRLNNQLRQHEAHMHMVDVNQRPMLDLFLSGTQGQTNTANDNNVDTFAVTGGIQVRWNLFDGFRTRYQKIEARLKENRLEAQIENEVTRLIGEQRRMLEDLRLRLRSLSLSEQRYNLALRQANAAENDFKANRITETEYRETRLNLEDAEIERQQARGDALLGLSDYATFIRVVSLDPTDNRAVY
jgi:outer membrane protein TolC